MQIIIDITGNINTCLETHQMNQSLAQNRQRTSWMKDCLIGSLRGYMWPRGTGCCISSSINTLKKYIKTSLVIRHWTFFRDVIMLGRKAV